MNVTCPECSTVYRVDPRKVPEGGVRARCARCPAEFLVATADGSSAVEPAAVGLGEAATGEAQYDDVAATAVALTSNGEGEREGYADVATSEAPLADPGDAATGSGAMIEDAGETNSWADDAADDCGARSVDDAASEPSDEPHDAGGEITVATDGGALAVDSWAANGDSGLEVGAGMEVDHGFGETGESAYGAEPVSTMDEGETRDDRAASPDDLPLLLSHESPDSGSSMVDVDLDDYAAADGVGAEPGHAIDASGSEVATAAASTAEDVERAMGYGDADDAADANAASGSVDDDGPVVIPVSSESDIAAATGTAEGFDEVPRPADPETDLPPPPFGSADPHARARRLARALVSDIVVYHPDRREKSLRQGTVRQEFREEIRKSWDEYVAHVGNQIARDTTYFRDALNELLAGGAKVF